MKKTTTKKPEMHVGMILLEWLETHWHHMDQSIVIQNCKIHVWSYWTATIFVFFSEPEIGKTTL